MWHYRGRLGTGTLLVIVICGGAQCAPAQQTTGQSKDQAIVEALLRLKEGGQLAAEPALRSAVIRYLDQQKDATRSLEVIRQLGIRDQSDRLLGLVVAQPESTEGVDAARLLLEIGDTQSLEAALHSDKDEVSFATAATLGLVGNQRAIDLVRPLVTGAGRSRSVRTAAAAALGRQPAGQRNLLELAREGQLPGDVHFAVANALFSSPVQQIRAEAAKYLERPAAAGSEPLPSVAELASRRGDAKNGKTVFDTNGTCAKCHTVGGEGKHVGPDLSEIGSKLSREALIVTILDPSAGISHNYETYNLITKEGVVMSGILVSQTDDAVTITTAEAVQTTIRNDQIDEMVKQTTSLMPADLHKNLSVENLVDLVDYMVLLRKNDQTPNAELGQNDAPIATARAESRRPEGALSGLDVADGLTVTLFASEPQLLNPANIEIDHLGRVWVCEIVNYRHYQNPNNPVRQEGDRILVLEDQDGDGRADKSTVFYQGRDIDSPHGICVLGNKAIVSAGDSVLVFTDNNGDLRADDKQVLFTGISGVQHDHGIHAFLFGPDGKLYFNFGNEGKQIKRSDGTSIFDLAGIEVCDRRRPYQEGMAFRSNLDASEFETLAWNFRNNWELCVDSLGTIWQSDNDDDGNRAVRINWVMEFGNYGYRDELSGASWSARRTGMDEQIPKRHWHLADPGVVPNLLETGAGSPTGILVYEGELLPEPFRNQIIHCDAGPGVVRAYPVQRAGAGYEARIVNILAGSRDKWFRPSDVCVAPDGSLIVADWYDPGVGGHNVGDLERGRLFRIAPEGHEGYRVSQYDFSSPEGAVAALASANLAARYLAVTSLSQRGAEAETALLALYEQPERPRLRARALWLLGRIPDRGEHYVRRAIKDKDQDIRIVGVRLARQLRMEMIPIVKAFAEDESAHVRRELAIALRQVKSAEAAKLWAQLARQHDGRDRWYLEALGIGADGQWDAFFAAWQEAVGSQWDTLGGRDIVWRSRAPAACEYLAKIVLDPETSAQEQLRYFRAFDFHAGPEKEKALRMILDGAGS